MFRTCVVPAHAYGRLHASAARGIVVILRKQLHKHTHFYPTTASLELGKNIELGLEEDRKGKKKSKKKSSRHHRDEGDAPAVEELPVCGWVGGSVDVFVFACAWVGRSVGGRVRFACGWVRLWVVCASGRGMG